MSNAAKYQHESQPPLRPVRLGPSEVAVEHRPDGALLIRSTAKLEAYPRKISEWLDHWARVAGDRAFLVERNAAGQWNALTYEETRDRVRRMAAALLQLDLSPERPIAILSGNDIDHALLALAATYVGIPYAPISPAYSLMSNDFEKLRSIIKLLTPGLVFANDGKVFARALEAAVAADAKVVVARNPQQGRAATMLSDLQAEPGASLEAAQAAIRPETIVKLMFTSGSTGTPKGVISTQQMMCSNQAMIASGFSFLRDEPPVVVDWLPWSHTFGGSHNFYMVLASGGTLYIDDGNPTPPGVVKTARNLREIAPTIYFNVPKGYEALVGHLRADRELRTNFFSRLKVLFYAGASLNQFTWDALQQLSIETCGERVIFLSSLGSTETAPLAIASTRDFDRAGNIGVPVPGVELKLVPSAGKLEARLRGPNITPGYWRQDALTREAFDEEGFYKLGDALKFANPAEPGQGLLFDGRIAEDFKLSTGTWVSVGPLRSRFLDHFAPYARDVVIAGADRDDIAVLIFPEVEACRKLCGGLPAEAPAAEVIAHPQLRSKLASLLRDFAGPGQSSSTRVCRLILLELPPSLDAGEMTDKGSINQRAVLSNRAALVDELYTRPFSPRVIGIEESA